MPPTDGPLAVEGARDQAADRSARLLETLLIAAAVITVEVVGTLVLALASGAQASAGELLAVFGLAVSPRMLIWLCLTLVVQLMLREVSRRRRWTLVLLAASVAVLLPTVISTVRYWSVARASWFGPPFVISAVVFTATVGLGLLIAAAIRSGRARTAAVASAVLVALGAILTLTLAWQFIEVNLAFFGERATITEADAERYARTATVAGVTYASGVVLALVSRSKVLVVTSLALAVLGVAVMLVFRVSAGG